MKKILFIVIILTTITISLVFLKKNEKEILMSNVYGDTFIWENYPIILKIKKEFPNDKKEILVREINNLNKIMKMEIFKIENSKITEKDNIVSWNNLVFRKGEQARTAISFKGNVYKKVNLYFNEAELKSIDFSSLVRHELGHAIGLKHQESGLMSEYLSVRQIKDWDLKTLAIWKMESKIDQKIEISSSGL